MSALKIPSCHIVFASLAPRLSRKNYLSLQSLSLGKYWAPSPLSFPVLLWQWPRVLKSQDSLCFYCPSFPLYFFTFFFALFFFFSLKKSSLLAFEVANCISACRRIPSLSQLSIQGQLEQFPVEPTRGPANVLAPDMLVYSPFKSALFQGPEASELFHLPRWQ